MSAILQVRGEDGQFIDIPALVGPPGADGTDGVSPTVSVSKSGKVTTITIVDATGTHTATINDGADGSGANHTSDGTAFAGRGYQGVVYIRWKKEDAA